MLTLFDLAKPILFRVDPELAHRLTINTFKLAQEFPFILDEIRRRCESALYPDPSEVCGLMFPGRVGLAAGFDKHAEVLPMIEALGFHFAGIGTVLPYEQAGNPRKRVFRLPEVGALINRMGFNSDGAEAVRKRLAVYKSRVKIPIGISLGMRNNRPLDLASYDYVEVLIELYDYADYFEINVSSPNTKGLRDLQGEALIEKLVRDVVDAVSILAQQKGEKPKPVFVKISPDLSEADLHKTLDAIQRGGASGVISGNTTIERRISMFTPSAKEEGGLSGQPLFEKALRVTERIRRWNNDFPIIHVGGLWNGDDCRLAIDAGADLVQLYTGFIYRGTEFVTEARKSLAGYKPKAFVMPDTVSA